MQCELWGRNPRIVTFWNIAVADRNSWIWAASEIPRQTHSARVKRRDGRTPRVRGVRCSSSFFLGHRLCINFHTTEISMAKQCFFGWCKARNPTVLADFSFWFHTIPLAGFHIDGMFLERPNSHSIYHIIEVPTEGETSKTFLFSGDFVRKIGEKWTTKVMLKIKFSQRGQGVNSRGRTAQKKTRNTFRLSHIMLPVPEEISAKDQGRYANHIACKWLTLYPSTVNL